MSRGNTWKEQRMIRDASMNEPPANIIRKVTNHVRECPTGHMAHFATTIDEFGRGDSTVLSCILCGTDTVQISLVREWMRKDHERFHENKN